MSVCVSRAGEYSSHELNESDPTVCYRCGDPIEPETDDEEDLLTRSSGTAKMRITGRLQRIATLTTELTKLYQEQYEDMRVLKAKADAYDKMVRLLRNAP